MIFSRRSQGAIEFMIIFGAMIFFFIMFFAIIQDNVNEKNREKLTIVAQNVALDLHDEINLAFEASNGYSREFALPENILGEYYEVNISAGRVYLTMEGYSVSYKSHDIIGTIIKGINFIKKENGVVYVDT